MAETLLAQVGRQVAMAAVPTAGRPGPAPVQGRSALATGLPVSARPTTLRQARRPAGNHGG